MPLTTQQLEILTTFFANAKVGGKTFVKEITGAQIGVVAAADRKSVV